MSSISVLSLIPAGEPLRVSIRSEVYKSRSGALIGMAFIGAILYGIIVLEDGMIANIPTSDFTTDWHYDVETDQWVAGGPG